MNLFANLFASRRPTVSDAARELARRGAEQRRETVKETARRMRAELGLPPSEALQ